MRFYFRCGFSPATLSVTLPHSVMSYGAILMAMSIFSHHSVSGQDDDKSATPLPSVRYHRTIDAIETFPAQTTVFQLSNANVTGGFYSTIRLDGANGVVYQNFSPANQPLVDYLASPKIQEQIELSHEQKEQFNSIRKKLNEGYTSIGKKYHQRTDVKASKKVREEANKKFNEEVKELRSEMEEEVKETLVPHQVNLIEQLKFKMLSKMHGFAYAVSNAPFGETLKTTDEQKKELAKIKMETEKAIQEKIAEMRVAGKEKMLKALNKNQRKKIKELEGDAEKKSSPKL